MAGIITGSINLSNIPKDKIIDGKKGKYLPISISINDELDQFGTNMMDATLSQAEKFKEMIGGKEKIKAGDIGEELKQKLLVEFGGLGLKATDLDNVYKDEIL